MPDSNLVWDFLSFRLLVTPSLLLIVYYFGAIVMPVLGYLFYKRLTRKGEVNDNVMRKGQLRESLSENDWLKKNRRRFMLFGFVAFLMMELGWRIFIEFFIAYFPMHNALMQISIPG